MYGYVDSELSLYILRISEASCWNDCDCAINTVINGSGGVAIVIIGSVIGDVDCSRVASIGGIKRTVPIYFSGVSSSLIWGGVSVGVGACVGVEN